MSGKLARLPVFILVLAVTLATLLNLRPQPLNAQSAGQAGLAAGRPFVDCAAEPSRIQQLRSGLPTMDEAISRTEAQFDAARRASLNASQDARQRALDAARSELQSVITDFVGEAVTLRRKVEALRQAGLSSDARRETLEVLRDLQEIQEKLQEMESYWSNAQKLLMIGQAGFQTGAELRNSARVFSQDVARLNDLFVRSGIADKIGETAAASFGPLGSLAFRAARAAIDIGVAVAESALSETEALQAQQNLDAMRYQRSRVEARIADRQALFSANCAQPQTVADSTTQVIPPAAITPPVTPPPAQAVNVPEDEGGGVGSALKWSAVAVGAGAGIGLIQRSLQNAGCDEAEGRRLAREYEDACYNRRGSCSAVVSNYATWCQSCGYSTFSTRYDSCQ